MGIDFYMDRCYCVAMSKHTDNPDFQRPVYQAQGERGQDTIMIGGTRFPVLASGEADFAHPIHDMTSAELGRYISDLANAYDYMGVTGSATPEQARQADALVVRQRSR